jgi:hypothetical protein
MREFLNILRVLTAVDVGIVVFCYLEDNMIWLYNTQTAFFSVSLIILGSFIGYSNMVKAQIQNGNVGEDILKKYEDPYNLDDEEDEIDTQKLEEYKKTKLKWYEALLFYLKGGFNLLRISGYAALTGGFIWLIKNGVFDYKSFLFGVSVVPAVSLIYLFLYKKRYAKN